MAQFDMIVVGSGPAGKAAAIQAAKVGKEVAIIDKGISFGGVCVHTGTVPSKTLRETVLNLTGLRERGFYGRSYRVKQHITASDLWQRLSKTLQQEVDILEDQLTRNSVKLFQGHARFKTKNSVEVTDLSGEVTTLKSDKFIISVGTKTFRPDYIPFDGSSIIDSDEVLKMQELPRSLVVIGAGVIGVEYASILNSLDMNVTLVEPRDTMLDFMDDELISEFRHQLIDEGLRLKFGTKVDSVIKSGKGVLVKLENGRAVQADMVLFAAGRVGATNDLGLDKIGLKTDHRGRLTVDDTFKTEIDNIYAAGDVIGFPSLASTSLEQGRIACCHAMGISAPNAPKHFPYGIYAVPEMSSVGMTEEEIRDRGIPYEIGISRFRETSRGKIMGIEDGFLKMIFSLKTRRLLGVHIVGEGATELIHIGQAVLGLKGTLDYFLESTFNYPTLAEAYKVASLDAHNQMRAARLAMDASK